MNYGYQGKKTSILKDKQCIMADKLFMIMQIRNAFALHLKNISLEMGTNSLGRVYGKYTHSVGDGYGYSKLSINFPEIMAVAALVIHVPGVLGAIETIGAVISIFD